MSGNHWGSALIIFLPRRRAGGRGDPGRDYAFRLFRRRLWKALRESPSAYRRVSRPGAKRPADEREPIGVPRSLLSCPDVGLAAGVTPAATMPSGSPGVVCGRVMSREL